MAATTLVFARAERRVVRVAVAVAATTVAAAIGAAAGSAAARGGRPAPSTEVAAGAELEQMARFEAQKNLFRARWAARAWATREGTDPGDGFLALARLDHALGDDERARKALAKIDARATSPRVREEAAKLRTAWGAPP
jgi:hypothetical protein